MEFFVRQFQRKNLDDKSFEEVSLKLILERFGSAVKLVDLCHFLEKNRSKSAIRRLIAEGAVQIDLDKCTDPDKFVGLDVGLRIKLGKRGFFKVV
ncbi:Tyrosine--tRNA ligase [compost metagenome]